MGQLLGPEIARLATIGEQGNKNDIDGDGQVRGPLLSPQKLGLATIDEDQLFEDEYEGENDGAEEALFRLIDTDSDGAITAHEIGSAWRSLGQHLADPELRETINEGDTDGSGDFDLQEFAAYMAQEEEGGRFDLLMR